jgi:hypothetical protein
VKKLRKINNNTKSKTVPKISKIYRDSWLDLSAFWRTLMAITLVYAVLYFIFVASVSVFPTIETLKDDLLAIFGIENTSRLIGSTLIVSSSLMSVLSASNSLLQIILFLIASSALVWAIRKQRGLKKINTLKSYYEGTANLIALFITSLLLLLTLIPSAIGSSLLSFGLPIAGSTTEVIILYSFAVILTLWSVYLILARWPAFYIAMLPGARPVASIRAAKNLTKNRRLKILARVLIIIVSLIIFFVLLVAPMALIWQRLIPITVYLTVMALFCVGNVLLFNLYRGLLDETVSKPKN